MRDTKHTRGPWIACYGDDGVLTIEQDRERLPEGEEPAEIARVETCGEGIDDGVAEENARLLAAAPELLAALRDLVDMQRAPGESFDALDARERAAFKAARSALRLAAGEDARASGAKAGLEGGA